MLTATDRISCSGGEDLLKYVHTDGNVAAPPPAAASCKTSAVLNDKAASSRQNVFLQTTSEVKLFDSCSG